MRVAILALAALLLAGCGDDENANAGPRDEAGWIGGWAAAPYGPYPAGPLNGVTPLPIALPLPSVLPGDQAQDQSFRMVARVTASGSKLRVRLSNLVGDRPLQIGPVRVALRAAGAAIMPGTDTPVTFGGTGSVSIPAGAEAVSDPVEFAVRRGDDIAVSFHVAGASGPITWHAVAFSLNYLGLPGTGDTTFDPSGATFTQPSMGWFFLSGIDVYALGSPGTIVAIGDSITDGAYQVPETSTRWPDFLVQRLADAGVSMGVLNQGINSNTVTREAVNPDNNFQGPPAVERFDRDVLSRPGVRSVVIFEGTNDLTSGVKADVVLAGIGELADRAHAAGLCVVVGTIMPRSDVIFGWNAATMESERQAINAALRADDRFEGLADFDEAMRSPLDPAMPNPLYYSPDNLHPTSLGFFVMANAVPLEALVPPPAGTCQR